MYDTSFLYPFFLPKYYLSSFIAWHVSLKVTSSYLCNAIFCEVTSLHICLCAPVYSCSDIWWYSPLLCLFVFPFLFMLNMLQQYLAVSSLPSCAMCVMADTRRACVPEFWEIIKRKKCSKMLGLYLAKKFDGIWLQFVNIHKLI